MWFIEQLVFTALYHSLEKKNGAEKLRASKFQVYRHYRLTFINSFDFRSWKVLKNPGNITKVTASKTNLRANNKAATYQSVITNYKKWK